MSSRAALLDMALMTTMADLRDQSRLLDMDIKNELGLSQKRAQLNALRTHHGDACVLEMVTPATEGSAGYTALSQSTLNSVCRHAQKTLQDDLAIGSVLSQESLRFVPRTFAGKVALKVGLIAGTAVTIGVYKRQLVELISDTVANVSLMATRFKDQNLGFGHKVRGTPAQVSRNISLVDKIIEESDKLQKTIQDAGVDGANPATVRQSISASIRRLISYGVPINQDGGGVALKTRADQTYTPTDAEKSGWTGAALTSLSGSLVSLEAQIKKATVTNNTQHTSDYVMKSELRVLVLQAHRACVRAARYVLYQVRQLMRVLSSVKFAYRLKF